MPRRKGSRDTRMTPGFSQPKKQSEYGKYRSRKDAFGDDIWSTHQETVTQGTLFSHAAVMNLPGNQELKRQRIGPRGYSKARLDEVRAGLTTDKGYEQRMLSIAQRKAEPWEVEAGYAHQHGYQGGEPVHWMPETDASKHIYGPEHGIKNKPGRNIYEEWTKRGRSKLLDTLARSSMPVEHLKGLAEIRVEPRHEEYAGTYHRAQDHESPSMRIPARIKLYGRHADSPLAKANQEFTLMHELGHHWSQAHSGTYGGYGTPEKQGIEEARADTYGLAHYRQDPRNRPEFGAQFDPRTNTYGGMGQAGKFGGTYKLAPHNEPPAERPHLPSGQLASEQAKHQPMLDMHLSSPVFTQRPMEVRHRTEDVPLQSGETRRGWVKQTEPAKHFEQVPHQEAIYRHEAFRNTQRVNRRDEAAQRREISQRWGVGRQFR